MGKKQRRLISFVLSVLLTVNQPWVPSAWGFPPALEVSIPSPGFQLTLPPELGTVQTIHSGTGPTLVHIQTAHGNYEAQKKIQAILHYLKDTYGFNLLLLEGSASKLNPELLKFFPDRMDLNIKMAEELAKEALVKGDELFLLEEPEADAYGIEEIEVYRKNREAFRAVLTQKDKTEGFLRDVDMQIERLAGHYLNKDLRSFLKRLDSFETKGLPLLDWLNYLKVESKQHLELDLTDPRHQIDWPMLLRIFKLTEFESKIDLNALDKEKRKFFKKIRRLPQETRKEIERLLSSPLSQNQLPDPETGLLFERMVAYLPRNFNFNAYPNVKFFIGHLILRSELKADRLFEEMNLLTDKISTQLAKTEEEKKLLGLFKDYRLLQRLFALELTPEDYEKFEVRSLKLEEHANLTSSNFQLRASNVQDLRPSAFITRLQAFNADHRILNISFEGVQKLDQLFDQALEFYQWAKKRDDSMLKKLEVRLGETGQTKAIVITGGFHAKPFKEFFQQRNYNYALIAPKITSTEGREVYLRAVLQNSAPALKKSAMDLPRRAEVRAVQEALGENLFYIEGRMQAVALQLGQPGFRWQLLEQAQEPVREGPPVPTTSLIRSEVRVGEERMPEFIQAIYRLASRTAGEDEKEIRRRLHWLSDRENTPEVNQFFQEVHNAMEDLKKMIPDGSRIQTTDLIDWIQSGNLFDDRRRERKLPPTLILDAEKILGKSGPEKRVPRLLAYTHDPQFAGVTVIFSEAERDEDIFAEAGIRWYQERSQKRWLWGTTTLATFEDKLKGLEDPSGGISIPSILEESRQAAEISEDTNIFWDIPFDGGLVLLLARKHQGDETAYRENILKRWTASSILAGLLHDKLLVSREYNLYPEDMDVIEEAALRLQNELGDEHRALAATGKSDKYGTLPKVEWRTRANGILETLQTLLKDRDLRQELKFEEGKPLRMVLRGFGYVATGIIEHLNEIDPEGKMIKIVGVNDPQGGIYAKGGLDLNKLVQLSIERQRKRRSGGVFNLRQEYQALDGPQTDFLESQTKFLNQPSFEAEILIDAAAIPPLNGGDFHTLRERGIKILVEAALGAVQRVPGQKFPFLYLPYELVAGGDAYTSSEEYFHFHTQGKAAMILNREELAVHVKDGVKELAFTNAQWLLGQMRQAQFEKSPLEILRAALKKIKGEKRKQLQEPNILVKKREDLDFEQGLPRKYAHLTAASEYSRERVIYAENKVADLLPDLDARRPDGSWDVDRQRRAAYILGKLRKRDAVEQLLRVLGLVEKRDSQVRANAAEALGNIGDWSRSRDELNTIATTTDATTTDEDSHVHAWARWAIHNVEATRGADVIFEQTPKVDISDDKIDQETKEVLGAYQVMSHEVAQRILELIRSKKNELPGKPVLIILPTGSTPEGLYAVLRKMAAENETKKETDRIDFSNVIIFHLDEYSFDEDEKYYESDGKLKKDFEGESYQFYMKELLVNDLVKHANFNPQRFHTPLPEPGILRRGDRNPGETREQYLSRTEEDFRQRAQEAVKRYQEELDRAIAEAGGIDLVVLGIGGADMTDEGVIKGGHIGFNEAVPDATVDSPTRVVDLSEKTRLDAHGRFKGVENVPHHAITMGIGTIMQAEEIFLLASGEDKAPVVEEALYGEISEDFPATFLRLHKKGNVTFFLDRDAAAALPESTRPWVFPERRDWNDPQIVAKAIFYILQTWGKDLEELGEADFVQNGIADLLESYQNRGGIQQVKKIARQRIEPKTHRPDEVRDLLPSNAVVVFFSPHPDDDVLTSGITIQKLAAPDRGDQVYIGYLVTGDGSVWSPLLSDLEKLKEKYPPQWKKFHQQETLPPSTELQAEIHSLTGIPQMEELLRNKQLPVEWASWSYEELKEKLSPDQVSQVISLWREARALSREKEAEDAARVLGVPLEHLKFFRSKYYGTRSKIRAWGKNPDGSYQKYPNEDYQAILEWLKGLVEKDRDKELHIFYSHEIDPHGAHGIGAQIIGRALEELGRLKENGELPVSKIVSWWYRGAYEEFPLEGDVGNVIVPATQEEFEKKMDSIWAHASQRVAMFPGLDRKRREFWERPKDRNMKTGELLKRLALLKSNEVAAEVFSRRPPVRSEHRSEIRATPIFPNELVHNFPYLSLAQVQALERGEDPFREAVQQGWTLEKLAEFLEGLAASDGIPLGKELHLISHPQKLFHVLQNRGDQTYFINLGSPKASVESLIKASRYIGTHEAIHHENASNEIIEEGILLAIEQAIQDNAPPMRIGMFPQSEFLLKEAEEVITDSLTLSRLGLGMLEDIYAFLRESLEFLQTQWKRPVEQTEAIPYVYTFVYRSVVSEKFAGSLPVGHPLKEEYERLSNQWAQLAQNLNAESGLPGLDRLVYEPFGDLFDAYYSASRAEVRARRINERASFGGRLDKRGLLPSQGLPGTSTRFQPSASSSLGRRAGLSAQADAKSITTAAREAIFKGFGNGAKKTDANKAPHEISDIRKRLLATARRRLGGGHSEVRNEKVDRVRQEEFQIAYNFHLLPYTTLLGLIEPLSKLGIRIKISKKGSPSERLAFHSEEKPILGSIRKDDLIRLIVTGDRRHLPQELEEITAVLRLALRNSFIAEHPDPRQPDRVETRERYIQRYGERIEAVVKAIQQRQGTSRSEVRAGKSPARGFQRRVIQMFEKKLAHSDAGLQQIKEIVGTHQGRFIKGKPSREEMSSAVEGSILAGIAVTAMPFTTDQQGVMTGIDKVKVYIDIDTTDPRAYLALLHELIEIDFVSKTIKVKPVKESEYIELVNNWYSDLMTWLLISKQADQFQLTDAERFEASFQAIFHVLAMLMVESDHPKIDKISSILGDSDLGREFKEILRGFRTLAVRREVQTKFGGLLQKLMEYQGDFSRYSDDDRRIISAWIIEYFRNSNAPQIHRAEMRKKYRERLALINDEKVSGAVPASPRTQKSQSWQQKRPLPQWPSIDLVGSSDSFPPRFSFKPQDREIKHRHKYTPDSEGRPNKSFGTQDVPSQKSRRVYGNQVGKDFDSGIPLSIGKFKHSGNTILNMLKSQLEKNRAEVRTGSSIHTTIVRKEGEAVQIVDKESGVRRILINIQHVDFDAKKVTLLVTDHQSGKKISLEAPQGTREIFPNDFGLKFIKVVRIFEDDKKRFLLFIAGRDPSLQLADDKPVLRAEVRREEESVSKKVEKLLTPQIRNRLALTGYLLPLRWLVEYSREVLVAVLMALGMAQGTPAVEASVYAPPALTQKELASPGMAVLVPFITQSKTQPVHLFDHRMFDPQAPPKPQDFDLLILYTLHHPREFRYTVFFEGEEGAVQAFVGDLQQYSQSRYGSYPANVVVTAIPSVEKMISMLHQTVRREDRPSGFLTHDQDILKKAGYPGLLRVLTPSDLNQRTAATLLTAEEVRVLSPELFSRVNRPEDLDRARQLDILFIAVKARRAFLAAA